MTGRKVPPPGLKKAGSSSSIENTMPADELDLLNLPPGRIGVRSLNATHAAHSGELTPTRSRSPSVMTRSSTLDGSISSIEDYDADILTDRAGISDELSESQKNLMLMMRQQSLSRDGRNSETNKDPNNPNNNLGSISSLPIVLERMTDDSLEDIHAFSDVTCNSATGGGTNSGRASVCSSNNYPGDALLLEPLEEGIDEEENDGVDEEEEEEMAVTITNLENLNLHKDKIVEEEDDHDDDDDDNYEAFDDAGSNQAVAKCSFQQLDDQQCGDDDDDDDDDVVAAKAATS
jgi:hypothetical protein